MEHFEKYKEFTATQNWAGICELNGIDLDSFGTKKELKALPNYLEPNEVVFAITSGIMKQTETSNTFDFGTNTWLVALTSERFIFLDAAMLTGSVDTQSIRHNKVQAVSASQGLLLGKIIVDLGSRMLVIDNCNKASVKVMANIANKWLQEIEERQLSVPTLSQLHKETPFDKLERLEKMNCLGAFSADEFKDAKQKILTSAEFLKQKKDFLSNL